MLSKHAHQSRTHISENRGGHGRSVNPRAGAPIRTDFPLEHEGFVVGVNPALIEHRAQRRHRARFEDALHRGFVGSTPYPIGRRPFSEEHA